MTILRCRITVLVCGVSLLLPLGANAQRQAEPLGRGVVAVRRATSQAYLGWRLLATDPNGIGFNVYRSTSGSAGVKLNANVLTNTTDYFDSGANFALSNAWYVRPVFAGAEQLPSAVASLAASAPVRNYIPVPMQGVTGGAYPPYDVKFAWVGDLDGDGEYDFVVDRLSTTTAANQYLQAYKRDGTFLWQMDMGYNSTNQYNIEPGASAISVGDKDNVTVYDMDGDGRAEVLVRTAHGVVLPDSTVIPGPDDVTQYISVLDGLSGVEKARATLPNYFTADGPLNCHFGIMYCDGTRPSLIVDGANRQGSGPFNYFEQAWDYRDGQLAMRWSWTVPANTNYARGHQIRIADVNHDGVDDLIEVGSVNNGVNGQPLFNTELAHGDRFHVMDVDPDRPGLETFAIQQDNSTLLATALYEAATGKFIKKWYSPGVVDVGRGLAMDFDPRYQGAEMYSTQPGVFDRMGNQIAASTISGTPPEGLWWDGDLLRETVDGPNAEKTSPVVNKVNYTALNYSRLYSIYNEGVHQAYGGRPAFWGDILGDWREEIVLVANDYSELRIFCSTNAAANRLYCLMQNPAYRMQATCKGYYQACYTDYHLGLGMQPPPPPPISSAQLVWRGDASSDWDTTTANWFTNNLWISNTTPVAFSSDTSVLFDLSGSNNAVSLVGALSPGDVTVHSPKDYTFAGDGSLTGVIKLTKVGRGKLTLNGTNTFSGATTVWEGPLIVNGSLDASPVTVRGGLWLDGALGGNGVVAQGVTVHRGGSVSPGDGANSPGTLTISNGVALVDGAFLRFDLSDDPTGATKTNDLLNVIGNLTLSGTNNIHVVPLNTNLPPGSLYPLIAYSGAFSGALSNIVVLGLPGIPVALTNPPGQIALIVKSYRAPATINWTGGSGGNVWNLLTTSNWLNGVAKDQFAPGDTVRFDNIGTSNLTANLSGDLNPASIIVNSTANYTLGGGGSIIGSTSLTKSNTGALTISALNNSYTGKTIIAGGTVVVSELDAVGYPSPLGNPPGGPTNLVLFGGSTLRVTGESYTDRGMTLNAGQNTLEVFNAADQVTMAGQIAGNGTLVKAGAGALALNVANTFNGGTIISNGTIALGSVAGNQTGVGTGAVTFYNGTLSMIDIQASETAAWPIIVPAGATGRVNVDGRCTLTGSLTGGGTLTIWTPYVRTDFNGNWSAFNGQINVITDDDGGDFRCNNSAGYPSAKMNLATDTSLQNRVGGTPTIPIGELSGAAGSSISAPGGNSGIGVNWSVGGLNTSVTYGGNTYNNVGFIKVGTGTWTWAGTNISHTGQTTVSGGTLLVNGNASTASGNVTVNSAGTLGGTGAIGGNTTVAGKLSPGTSIGTLAFGGNLTLGASSTTMIEINKTAGTQDLSDVGGMLTYGGALQVTNLAGTLASGDSFNIFDAATYTGSFAAYNLPTLTAGLGWNVSALPTSGTISVVVSNATTAPKAVTWKGDGLANAWDINTTANWLDTNNAAAFFANYDSVTFNDAGSNNAPILLQSAVQPASLTVNATKSYTLTGSGAINGTNSLTKSGTGTLTLSTTNGYTGGTTISAGTVTLLGPGSGLAHRWSFNNSLADSVGGQNATVVDVGANNTTLSATEITLAGGTQGSSDYVDLGDDVLPNGTAPVTIELWAKTLSVQNWSRIFDFGSATTENVFMSWTRGTTLTQDRVEWVDTAGTTTANDTCQPYTLGVEFHVAMVIEPGAGTGGTTRVTWYRAASINSTLGAARGTFNTTNTLAMMNDTNCWLGRSQWPDNTANASYNEVRVWNRALSASDLQMMHTNGPDAGMSAALPAVTTLNLTGSTAKLDLQNNQAQTVASLTGVTGSEVKLTTGSLVAGGDNTSTTFAGFFSGTNGFTKTGTGALTLTGNSTHTGSTTVSAGTLQVHGNNSAANGAVSVASGATLGGNGTLGGATTIQPGGKLAPGASIGAITFTNTLTLSGTTLMEISHTPLTNDMVNKTDALTYGGALLVTNIAGTLAAGDNFKLFNAPAYSGSFNSLSPPALSPGLVWNTSKLSTSGTLWVVTTNPPVLTVPSVSGGNFAFGGIGGTPGWNYFVLSSTNILSPLSQWTRIATNQFDASGNCSVIVPMNLLAPARFYRLEVP